MTKTKRHSSCLSLILMRKLSKSWLINTIAHKRLIKMIRKRSLENKIRKVRSLKSWNKWKSHQNNLSSLRVNLLLHRILRIRALQKNLKRNPKRKRSKMNGGVSKLTRSSTLSFMSVLIKLEKRITKLMINLRTSKS